mmetsp:Transcript_47813/g.102451  ORF Transcript_47813/g.102451 Transcript_47813/m.102451 type:complete len:105 (-) Transcript_47813:133-447(-)
MQQVAPQTRDGSPLREQAGQWTSDAEVCESNLVVLVLVLLVLQTRPKKASQTQHGSLMVWSSKCGYIMPEQGCPRSRRRNFNFDVQRQPFYWPKLAEKRRISRK